jgi:ATP-dependent Clp protease ATP-binding subunit ClpB
LRAAGEEPPGGRFFSITPHLLRPLTRLSRSDLARIVDIQLERLERLLAERKLTLVLTAAARDFLAERGYDPVFGARPLKRAMQRYLQDPLALALLGGEFGEGDTVEVDAAGDELGLHFKSF